MRCCPLIILLLVYATNANEHLLCWNTDLTVYHDILFVAIFVYEGSNLDIYPQQVSFSTAAIELYDEGENVGHCSINHETLGAGT